MNGLAMLGVWATVAVAIAVIAGWAPLQAWLEAHEKLAAWVQAVGSVAAIGLSVWVVQRQHRLELRRQATAAWQSTRAGLQGLLQVMSGVQQVIVKVSNIARARAPNAEDLIHLSIELETLLNSLSRTDYLRFETHTAIEGVAVTESLGRTLLLRIREAYPRLKSGDSELWGPIIKMANECAIGTDARAKALFASIEAMVPPK
ncbi:hypothetical protein [Variovorax sp.]|uniref:hypothetical protein n=1 Tax=Variovorax sp. TaxID=1871043 RepID=UPI003BAD7E96